MAEQPPPEPNGNSYASTDSMEVPIPPPSSVFSEGGRGESRLSVNNSQFPSMAGGNEMQESGDLSLVNAIDKETAGFGEDIMRHLHGERGDNHGANHGNYHAKKESSKPVHETHGKYDQLLVSNPKPDIDQPMQARIAVGDELLDFNEAQPPLPIRPNQSAQLNSTHEALPYQPIQATSTDTQRPPAQDTDNSFLQIPFTTQSIYTSKTLSLPSPVEKTQLKPTSYKIPKTKSVLSSPYFKNPSKRTHAVQLHLESPEKLATNASPYMVDPAHFPPLSQSSVVPLRCSNANGNEGGSMDVENPPTSEAEQSRDHEMDVGRKCLLNENLLKDGDKIDDMQATYIVGENGVPRGSASITPHAMLQRGKKVENNTHAINEGPTKDTTTQRPTDNAWFRDKRDIASVVRMGQPTTGPYIFKPEDTQAVGSIAEVGGKMVVDFSDVDNKVLAGHLGHAVVGKFSHSLPTRHQIQKVLGNVNLVGTYTLKHLNAKHVLIELSELCDYVKILCGHKGTSTWYIDQHPMRVFKWTPDFDPFFESPIVPLWCNLPGLPVHLFHESALLTIGRRLGRPVQADRATITRARVSFARICIEVDISRPLPESFDLRVAGKDLSQRVIWDRIPLYCTDCKHVGHSADRCYAFGKRPKPVRRDYSVGKGGVASGSRSSAVAGQPQDRRTRDSQTVQGVEQHPQQIIAHDRTTSVAQSSSGGETDTDGFTRAGRRARRRRAMRQASGARGGSGQRGLESEVEGVTDREGRSSVPQGSNRVQTVLRPARVTAGGGGAGGQGTGTSSVPRLGVVGGDGSGHDGDRIRRQSSSPSRGAVRASSVNRERLSPSAHRDRQQRSLSPVLTRQDGDFEAGCLRSERDWRAQQKALAEVHLITNNAFEALANEEEDGLFDDSDTEIVFEEDANMVEAAASRVRLLEAPKDSSRTEGVDSKKKARFVASPDQVSHV